MARGQHPDTLGTLKIAGFSGCLLPKDGHFMGNSTLKNRPDKPGHLWSQGASNWDG